VGTVRLGDEEARVQITVYREADVRVFRLTGAFDADRIRKLESGEEPLQPSVIHDHIEWHTWRKAGDFWMRDPVRVVPLVGSR
jgi:hypothetical protein